MSEALAGQNGPVKLGTPSRNANAGQGEGVIEQHDRRMSEDSAYRNAALGIDASGPQGLTTGKSLARDEPTGLSADHPS